MQDIIKAVEKKQLTDRNLDYSPGDTINVSFKIREGDKERLQQFQGVVIQTNGTGVGSTVTVRKVSSAGVYVEKVFPAHSPLIADVKLVKRGLVRRAKLYYLRGRTGKATRIKEKK
ncbi:50S ribosomal protein L19 [Chitinispirillales bacterium ANBcel5]|uniref:50S ribosomal protein L19 n=1 Tax=Cellulosispirillum alkaliphilum TaxID=3039283 RepID=UPI002A595475|nr:50S ribosomal protein L19 [Chitinispirillales bacterium ANBcel5]